MQHADFRIFFVPEHKKALYSRLSRLYFVVCTVDAVSCCRHRDYVIIPLWDMGFRNRDVTPTEGKKHVKKRDAIFFFMFLLLAVWKITRNYVIQRPECHFSERAGWGLLKSLFFVPQRRMLAPIYFAFDVWGLLFSAISKHPQTTG